MIDQKITTSGSYFDVIKPNDDPQLDMIVRNGVHLTVVPDLRAVKVDFGPELQQELSSFGRIARVELLCDAKFVEARSMTFWKSGQTFRLRELPPLPEVLNGNVDGDWVMIFRIDHAAMAAWNYPAEFWPGTLVVPIDWQSVRHDILSFRENLQNPTIPVRGKALR